MYFIWTNPLPLCPPAAANKAFYRYSMPAKDVLLLKGYFKRDSLNITLKKYDPNNFRLLNRGFHWINESPYNK
jgi:hypothetical protein